MNYDTKHDIIADKINWADRFSPTIDVGLGWLPIIDRMVDRFNESGIDYTMLQIKEKFGGLRVYFTQPATANSKLDAYVSIACREAEETCEMCGVSGQEVDITNGGLSGFWMRNLCFECGKEWRRE